MPFQNIFQLSLSSIFSFVLQFWKKQEVGLEFVKHFRAHLAPIKNMTVNSNGTLMISISEDKHGKVFDVVNFDMINILAFDFTPEVAAWIHQPGDAIQVQFQLILEQGTCYYKKIGYNVDLF